MGIDLIVLWPAREGTYIREAKDPIGAVGRLIEAINDMLAHDPKIRFVGEMKPNEPMDQAYCPTVGHFMGLSYRTADPDRVGVSITIGTIIALGGRYGYLPETAILQVLTPTAIVCCIAALLFRWSRRVFATREGR